MLPRSTLAVAYANVLKEALASETPIRTLRLLPISGGVFSARWAPDMHHLTFAALALAFEQGLDDAERAALVDKVDAVSMCIFLEKELGDYERALAWRRREFQAEITDLEWNRTWGDDGRAIKFEV